MTIIVQDYNSTYSISSVIGVRPVLMSNDHRQGWRWIKEQGGGVPNMGETTMDKSKKRHSKRKEKNMNFLFASNR